MPEIRDQDLGKQRTTLKIKNSRENLNTDRIPKPEWLKIRAPTNTENIKTVKSILQSGKLNTVCAEAACPNISFCFNQKRATFLIMGSKCTRRCPYCDIAHGKPDPLDPSEPRKLALTAKELGLKYVVITSVNRDDLKDGGASQYGECIREIRSLSESRVEILVPDFRGRLEKALAILSEEPPDVFNHNIETVPRLFRSSRPGGSYEHSLNLLLSWHKAHPSIPTKSGIMVGLGETDAELIEVLKDLRASGVSMVTIGQYLPPSKYHQPVDRYVSPKQFENYKNIAFELGFTSCASGVFIRSSYQAYEQAKNFISVKN